MNNKKVYKPEYSNSWALIIGINAYQFAPPLRFACNDAKAIAELLVSRFGFSQKNTTLLLDEEANRKQIMSQFLDFCGDKISENDRLLVFFAGHGHTRSGSRGEVGFLVPVDGNAEDLSTLIRWDELTRNSELILAKHLLFIMDACYGGLALKRQTTSGSMRFAKDKLKRYSRQVLTAGKADEPVSDSGGPKQGHSIFTGNMLEALEGAAASDNGILNANSVMSYVYKSVSEDPQSQQTPHYGFIDGDGDFFFNTDFLKNLSKATEKDNDILIETPVIDTPQFKGTETSDRTEIIKDYISDSKYSIRLDDLINTELRSTLSHLDESQFPLNTDTVTPEEFANRLKEYESIIYDLQKITILLARWGSDEHIGMLEKILARISDRNVKTAGKVVWVGLQWYPTLLLMYSGGISALSNKNYEKLSTIFTTKVHWHEDGRDDLEIILPTIRGITEVEGREIFKTLPGHERHYVPRSEYLFKALQPILDDVLFLGRSYENLFDKFEVFLALVFADLGYNDNTKYFWGPTGRFGWKYKSHRNNVDPLTEIITDAVTHLSDWPPLRQGLFQGSIERFKIIADKYKGLLDTLPWH